MTDPVPVRRNGGSNLSYDATQSFFVKGDESKDSSSDVYKHVSSDDDSLIINGQGGSYKLHRNTLKETLAELKPHAHVSVRHLSPEHTEAFRSIVEALRLLHGSQSLYDLVLNDIRTVFADVKDVKPGTVAAFFIGCFSDDKFPGPMGCSPKCAASLPPSEGTPGYANCDDLVLIYSEGLFSSLNEKRSTHAYIYIGEADFTGFTSDNLRQLRDAEIENASLIFGNQDGSYREVTSALNIDQLPSKADPPATTQQQQQDPNSTPSNAGAGVALAIIIIVIVILVIVLLVRGYNQ
jgi:hypothetical protein